MPAIHAKPAAIVTWLLLSVALSCNATAQAEDSVLIRIDDLEITLPEFEEIFRSAVRHKYYHGRVPPAELEAFRRRVVDDIVTQVVVHRDALAQGIEPNRESIDRGIDEFDAKYAGSPEWQAQRERVIPLLARRLERQDVLEQMRARVEDIPQPAREETETYYREHPEKFTEPRRVWGSVILFGVAPSAGEETWRETIDLASQVRFRLAEGEEFAALARQYSVHASAVNGGDLGYLHAGMLDDKVQQRVDQLEVGEVTEPVRVLEGVILFRLNGVQPASLKPFEEVQKRARGLLHRNMQQQAWDEYVGRLKARAKINVNEELYARNTHE